VTKVAVRESVMRWALSRSNLTQQRLASRFPRIQEWIDGTTRPTLRQVERLAKATRTPLGYFFLAKPLEDSLPIPHFRTIRDKVSGRPSPDLLETVHTMQRRQAWMRQLLVEEGKDPLSFVGSARHDEEPVFLAQALRQALGLADDWAAVHKTWTHALRALREATEAAGVLLVSNGVVGNNTHRKLDVEEFRGFVLVDEYAPLVFLNNNDGKAPQMFTLAHELAHLLFGVSAAFDLRRMEPARDAIELACNHVAAEFLIPAAQLRQLWPTVRDRSDPFGAAAREFKVSAIVAARRALDLALIRRSDFLVFYQRYLKQDRRRSESREDGGDFYSNQDLRVGRRFAVAVMTAAEEGKLSYTEAYRLTGLHGAAFTKYGKRLGIGGFSE